MKRSSRALADPAAEITASKTIRSFVRREHRMTPGQARALKEWWPKYGLSSETGIVDCSGECILEIGFGMGQSLVAMATQNPDKFFYGIEVHRPGIGALLAVLEKQRMRMLGSIMKMH